MDFAQRYGTMAVIAGGSEGVGAAYARLLAERGIDLALVARNPATLAETAEALRRDFPGREVLTLATDLTDPGAAAHIEALTGGREVGLLIYNAGASTRSGDFVDGDLEFAERLVALNVTAKMALAHHYGRAMKARGRGGIIMIGSFAAFIGNPGQAVYSAAKAFSATFAEALWHELAPYGVHVLGHILGQTATPSVARAFPRMVGVGADPATVAAAGLAALDQGPILRATGGDALAQSLMTLDRGAAVKRMYEAGAAYRD